MNTLHIKTCLFTSESQAIRSIRVQVFQEEQGISPELEWDGLDDQAIHLVAQLGEELIAVARLREIHPSTVKLERLAVLPDHRHQGIGSEMVQTAIAYSKDQGYQKMILHAQSPTVGLYESLGFVGLGEPFMEANIEHLKMVQDLC
jgi:predicted GNAT family N-acyltransferase